MLVKNNNVGLTFGWTQSTHRKLVKFAVGNVRREISESNIETLKKFVVMPDLDETGIFSNKHFYFPKRHNLDAVSFLDYDGKHNAKAAFGQHIEESILAMENKDKQTAFESFGRALHFLQDMCMPLHTDRRNILGKAKNSKRHIGYEVKAMDIEKTILHNIELDERPKKFNKNKLRCYLEQLFDDNVAFSAVNKVKNKGKISCENVKRAYTKAVTSTVEALNAFVCSFK